MFGENAESFQTDCYETSGTNCAFYALPSNYRPPSIYGKSIPVNDRLYNADLNQDLTAGIIVEFIASKWDTIKKNAENWFFDSTSQQWNQNCRQDVTVDGKTEKFSFSQFDTHFGRAECLRYVMHVKVSFQIDTNLSHS